MLNWKTDVCHYLGTSSQIYLLRHWYTPLKNSILRKKTMAGGITLISSEISCFRLCTSMSAGRISNTLLSKKPNKNKTQTDRSGKRVDQKISRKQEILQCSDTIIKMIIDCRVVSTAAASAGTSCWQGRCNDSITLETRSHSPFPHTGQMSQ